MQTTGSSSDNSGGTGSFPSGNDAGRHPFDRLRTGSGRPFTRSIHVSIRDQQLSLKEGDETIRTYPVSTSRFGIGSEEGSNKTPIGRFRVAEKIGGDMPSGTIFRSRIPLGPADSPPPTEDLVLSRILWLDGVDDHNTNTRDRYIYIHGTRHEHKIGSPDSHGCVRMRNADVIELFDLVDENTPVVIEV